MVTRWTYWITTAVAAAFAAAILLPAVTLVRANDVGDTPRLFGLSDYITALALLLVLLSVSDFRTKYRLSFLSRDLRTSAFWVAASIGGLILVSDYWFEKQLPIPQLLNDHTNIQLALAALFLLAILYVNYVAFLRPPKFSGSNCERYTRSLFSVIGEGNTERMAVAADELRRSISKVVELAAQVPPNIPGANFPPPSKAAGIAHDLLLLLGDRRFCRTVATQAPWLASDIFWELRDHPQAAKALGPFSSNVSAELIMGVDTILHQEDSGAFSGLIGESQPLSTAIYGSWSVVEACSQRGFGPLDLQYQSTQEMGELQADAFARVALMFADDFFEKTRGNVHSYALYRCMSAFEHMASHLLPINDAEDYGHMGEYKRLRAAVEFASGLVELLDKHNIEPDYWYRVDPSGQCWYDRISKLFVDIIFSATAVSTSDWRHWHIQHNTVWNGLFPWANETQAGRHIKHKVTRLIWSEISEMSKWPNFKGARLLGFCLNVLGLKLLPRKNQSRRDDFYPLQKLATEWTRKNYARVAVSDPKVAEAILLGSITYDSNSHKIVKTFSSDLGNKPNQHTLELLPASPVSA